MSSVIKDHFRMKLGWNLVVQTLSLPLSGRKVHVLSVCVSVRERERERERERYKGKGNDV